MALLRLLPSLGTSILMAYVVGVRSAVSATSSPAMSYVMDPFESSTNKYFQTVYGGQGAMNVTTVDAAFGESAIQVDYQVVQTETWGGFVDFGRVATRAHNCNGATHISIWYKVLKPQSAKLRCHLRLVLLDDSDCSYPSNCTDPDELEQFYSFQYILDDSRADWRELRVELRGDTNSESPFWQTGWAGISGNAALDLQHIRGWRIEMNIDSQGDVGSSSGGSISFDQLACLGGGELFGAALQNPGNGFSDAVAAGKWAEVYNHSAPSKISMTSEFVNQSLVIQYSSNRSVTLKESRSYIHVAPDPAYYNLSQVETISLDYSTTQAAPALTRAGNMAIQMHLIDGSTCDAAVCEEYPDSNAGQDTALTASVNGTDASGKVTIVMPHTVPSAQKTNLNSSLVKGFSLTVNIGPAEALSPGVEGQVTLSNLLGHSNATGNSNEVGSTSESTCTIEPNFIFDINQEGVRKMEFVSSKCCQICDSDKDCIYAQSDGMHCYMASHLNSSSVGHTGLVASQDKIRAFWMDDKDKRGDFCEVCECRGFDRTIDCRGRNLPILPKTFTTLDGTWSPLVLDLRDNPSLVLVGLLALEELSSTLQELRLPSEVRHLAYGCFQQLTSLKTLTFASNHSSAVSTKESLRNSIVESTDFFGNVCCKPGMHIELQSPPSGLTFCNMTPSTPGIDATYEPFIEFFDGKVLATIQRSSTFMSEASESAELCAEYCAIRDDCRYYAYDGRQSNAEPKCHHLETKGTPTKVCCNSSDDFADANQTKPGWISGLVPKTRNELENARVVAASSNHTLSKTNNYTSNLIFSLGSLPLRGAVWIRPILAADTEFDVSFRPPRVALYDNVSIAVVEVTIVVPLEIKQSGKVHVTTEIESCDAAFLADDFLATDRIMELDVVLEVPSSRNLVVWITLSFAVVVLVVAAYLYVDHKKRKADTVWIIHPSELTFRDPPEVLGRGTFGLVLLAEYRGTQVAVKRVIPPSCGSLNHSVNSSLPLTRRSSYRSESLTLRSSMGRTLRQSSNQLKEEFMAEMRLLSKLRHPCVTTVMGAVIGRNEDPMLIMEYMEHGSLYDLLHNGTMIIEGESILPILRDIAQGVRFLHAANPQVIHGDLKAQNILVDGKFRSKVADFGLSQKKRLGVTGTPFWMAPELLNGTGNNSAQTDVYSFGIILYEVYSRKEPYEGENPSDVLRLVADPVVQKRPPVPASCPTEIQALMAECLSSQPQRRPTFKDLDVRLKSYDVSTVEPGETRFSAQFKKEQRTSTLLSDVFPEHIAAALRNGRKVEPEARDMVTIFFSDIVGFTTICQDLPPIKISDLLDRLYSKLDALSHVHDVFKVETIGDAYMAVTNLTKDQASDHTKRIADFAVAAVSAANETPIDVDKSDQGCVQIRAGFHCGPVVANVVGSRNPRYCLFGDTVNTAARMESHSAANRIHCSKEAAALLQVQHASMPLCSRGRISVKGKGEMFTYWVNEEQKSIVAPPESYKASDEQIASQRHATLGSAKLAKGSNVAKFPLKIARRSDDGGAGSIDAKTTSGTTTSRPRLRRSLTPEACMTAVRSKTYNRRVATAATGRQKSMRSLASSSGSVRSLDFWPGIFVGKQEDEDDALSCGDP